MNKDDVIGLAIVLILFSFCGGVVIGFELGKYFWRDWWNNYKRQKE